MAEAAAAEKTKPGWGEVFRSLNNRKSGFMVLFGFASGLPFALFLGTLYAWLTEAEVPLETMGVFSLIGLAYAFQFIWSPLIDKVNLGPFRRFGKRKQWIVPAQILLGAILVTMSVLEPKTQLGWFSLLAGIGAIASATQDIAINAWRIDVADEEATLDILSTIYQMGYRLASLVGGALGLIIAARIGWPETYLIMGAILLTIGFFGTFAPDSGRDTSAIGATDHELAELYAPGEVAPDARRKALWAVLALWGWALLILGIFMVRALGGYVPMLATIPLGGDMALDPNWLFGMFALNEEGRPDPTEFTAKMGPVIILATIVLPAIIAALLAKAKRTGDGVIPAASGEVSVPARYGALDHLYRALLLPLVEFVGRMGWSLMLILSLVLTYRICDAIWGTFAYPFYLGELKYTNDEVAFASKFFGVGAVIAGLAFGGYLLTVIGRMATLTIGAILAALTNLLYADMAVGGANMQAASDAIGFSWLIAHMAPFGSEGLPRLTFTIMWENLAIGIAGAAYVAWLSSIVSKKYAAVQYALLSSLTLLIGTLGRGALGEMIEDQGYYYVFILTTLIGGIAVVLCIAEWIREKRAGSKSGIVTPDHQVSAGS
ncbi:MFS transporter [Alteriqipengyuania flavescens]|uniref:MFS transporter n=1 Tax=Alteriqipengyuania flavescens TaxID=3053610 RepID=UPI0025B2B187|nr:MFS transporter [Alteriqipengyuania flavescens]WJY18030.1 MFS transporter [Alteriqipengyuania flavescens]WJY23971.1 MFS transporter [Alteriqipengyuania flavescens]